MEDEKRVNDYNIKSFDDEKVYVEYLDEINKSKDVMHSYFDLRKVTINYYNQKKIFYVRTFKQLKKCVGLHLGIPSHNQIFYVNKKNRIYDFDFKRKQNIQLEVVNNFDFIKIKVDKYPLVVSRHTSSDDIIYYLIHLYNVKFDYDVNPRLFYNNREIFDLYSGNIINGDKIDIKLMETIDSIKSKINENKTFVIFVRTLKGRSQQMTVCSDLTVQQLYILLEEYEGNIELGTFGFTFKGRGLEFNKKLSDYDVYPEATIWMNLKLRGGKI